MKCTIADGALPISAFMKFPAMVHFSNLCVGCSTYPMYTPITFGPKLQDFFSSVVAMTSHCFYAFFICVDDPNLEALINP